jgi:hypothetical protein
LWREAPELAHLMSQESWQGPGVRFHPTRLRRRRVASAVEGTLRSSTALGPGLPWSRPFSIPRAVCTILRSPTSGTGPLLPPAPWWSGGFTWSCMNRYVLLLEMFGSIVTSSTRAGSPPPKGNPSRYFLFIPLRAVTQPPGFAALLAKMSHLVLRFCP